MCFQEVSRITLQRPQTCFLSGSLSIHPGCQRHDQTPLLFPTCGRTDNVFSILEHSWCVLEEVGQKAARLSSLAAGGQPASFSFFICENHRNARSHARSQRKDQNNREAEALLRRRTATVILDTEMDRISFSIQRLRKGHLIILILRQTKDSRKKPCMQHKLLVPGKNQNQDDESSRQPGQQLGLHHRCAQWLLMTSGEKYCYSSTGSLGTTDSKPDEGSEPDSAPADHRNSEYRTKLVLRMNGWMEGFWTFILLDFKRVFIDRHWSKVKNNLPVLCSI